MSMHIDGKKVTAMYWGGRKIREAWYEGKRVFSGKPVEVMPPTVGPYDAMDWLRATLTEYGESHETVKELPFEIDSSQVTDMLNMFQNCHALTSVPAMDTRNVAYMGNMFGGCWSLTSVPDMDTSKVTNMSSMFSDCSSLTVVPEMDTSNVTNMGYMFDTCRALTSVPDMDTSKVTFVGFMFRECSSLTDGGVRLIGKHPDVVTVGMIQNSGLTREPFYDINGQPI